MTLNLDNRRLLQALVEAFFYLPRMLAQDILLLVLCANASSQPGRINYSLDCCWYDPWLRKTALGAYPLRSARLPQPTYYNPASDAYKELDATCMVGRGPWRRWEEEGEEVSFCFDF